MVQLLPFQEHLVTPSFRFDPLHIVVQTLKAIMMYLLKEIIKEDGIPNGVILLYKVPARQVPLHVLQHWTNKLFSILGSGTDGLGHKPSISLVGILLPPHPSKLCRVSGSVEPSHTPRGEAGLTGGGSSTTSSGVSLSLVRLTPFPVWSQSPSSGSRLIHSSHQFLALVKARGILSLFGDCSLTTVNVPLYPTY